MVTTNIRPDRLVEEDPRRARAEDDRHLAGRGAGPPRRGRRSGDGLLHDPLEALGNFVAENHEKMNKNGLVLDVCGVKRDIMACFRAYFFEDGPQYIGMHPDGRARALRLRACAGRSLPGREPGDDEGPWSWTTTSTGPSWRNTSTRWAFASWCRRRRKPTTRSSPTPRSWRTSFPAPTSKARRCCVRKATAPAPSAI